MVFAQAVRGALKPDLRTGEKPLGTSSVSHVVLQECCCYLDNTLQRLSLERTPRKRLPPSFQHLVTLPVEAMVEEVESVVPEQNRGQDRRMAMALRVLVGMGLQAWHIAVRRQRKGDPEGSGIGRCGERQVTGHRHSAIAGLDRRRSTACSTLGRPSCVPSGLSY